MMKWLPAPRFTLALTWGFTISIVISLVVVTSSIRKQHHEDGVKAAQGYARLVAEHVAGSLQAADLTLSIIIEHLKNRHQWPDHISGRGNAEIREQITREMAPHLPRLHGAVAMLLTNPTGDVVSRFGSSLANIPGPRFLDQVKHLPQGGIAVSEAYRDDPKGPLMMMVARPIQNSEGRFVGLVGIVIDLEQRFNSFYASLQLPPEAAISLYSTTNRLLSRFPQVEEQIGKSPKTPEIARLLDESQNGTLFAKSAIDQQQRAFVLQTIPDYPVRLLVSLAEAQFMATAYLLTQAAIYCSLGLIILAAFLSHFAIRRRQIADEANALIKGAQDSLMAHVAVLDRHGIILSVNDGWREFAEANAKELGVPVPKTSIGTNYLSVCQGANGECSAEAEQVANGIQCVLDGCAPSFQITYPCHSPTEKRWFQMMAAPLRTSKGGAVVSHTNITRLVLAEEALRESEQHLRNLANSGAALIWTSGLDMGCDYFNDTWLRFTGRELAQELGNGWAEGVHPEDHPRVMQTYVDAFAKRQPFSMDYRLRNADGAYRWIQDDGSPRYDVAGEFIGYIGSCLDISERKRQETELRKLNQVVEQSPDSILVTDAEGNIEFVNESFLKCTGYRLCDVMGKNPSFLRSDKTPRATHESLWASLREGQVWRGEFINKRRDGSEIIESATVGPVRDEQGRVTHFLALQRDITSQRRAEEEVNRLSFYDPLTGLANRALLLDRVARSLHISRQKSNQDALLIIDLDRFKTFNDARGHDLGDRLLVAVARRISSVFKNSELLARLSGDEFALLLQDHTHHRDHAGRWAMSAAEAIHRSLELPFKIGDDDAIVSASIGIALIPEVLEDTAQDILRRADTALHRAKESGGKQTAFFEAKMGELVQQRFQVERDLRVGIQGGQLRLYLQPQVDAAGRMVGAEALVRWQHPERGLVAPGQFIPVAEESDLIVDLDVWVFQEVCKVLSRTEMAEARIRISVNVSPRHFRQVGFVPWVKQTLLANGTDPGRLTLEITEGLVIDNVSDVIAKMNALAELGIHFSLDDFGTGYSSLAYLKRLPIKELKIDKSFVQDAPRDTNDAALVETILSVANHMRLTVVAEGVETREQAEFLNARGTVVHQGFLYGRPEPVEQWLERYRLPT